MRRRGGCKFILTLKMQNVQISGSIQHFLFFQCIKRYAVNNLLESEQKEVKFVGEETMHDMEMMLHVSMAAEGIQDYPEGGPADIGRDYWDIIMKDRMANWDALDLESRESKLEGKKDSRLNKKKSFYENMDAPDLERGESKLEGKKDSR